MLPRARQELTGTGKEGGCVQSTSRSTSEVLDALMYSQLLRLVFQTQPRSFGAASPHHVSEPIGIASGNASPLFLGQNFLK